MQEHIIQYVLQPRYPLGIMMESQKLLENCQFYEVFEEGREEAIGQAGQEK